MFNQAQLLDEQVESHLHRLRRTGWLTFKGAEAIDLLRKVAHLKLQPILVAHCHHSLIARPNDFEYFVPARVTVDGHEKLVKVEGRYLGPDGVPQTLYWRPGQSWDSSGTFLSGISTLASAFPANELAAVELPALSLEV